MYASVCIHTHTYIHTQARAVDDARNGTMHACTYIYICICMPILHIHMCMYVYAYVYACKHMYIYMYAYIHIHTHTYIYRREQSPARGTPRSSKIKKIKNK